MPNALNIPPVAPQIGLPQGNSGPVPNAGMPMPQGPMPAPIMPQSPPAAPPAMSQQQPQAPAPPQQPPAPTHDQAVAVLRHFDAIEDELKELLQNPQIGRSSIKSAIIDGTTKLVARRIITPKAAVEQLGTVPDDPIQQRKWIMQHAMNAHIAKIATLEQHRAAFANVPEEMIQQKSDPEAHLDTMASVTNHYRGGDRRA